MAVNTAKLRDQARNYEAREQWREAAAAYRQVLDAKEGGEPDIGLWNRVGDLHLKMNEQDKAVEAYESAVNAYVEVGLYNNAIALCRKILRLVPGRANVYRRLGQISAAKGFFADARQNFLEYADRMRRAGQIDAAFEGLREFADLSPDDAEIRRVLADQLLSHGHKDEAVEQLRILLGMLLSRADEEAAEAVRHQIRVVDPNASTEPLARTQAAGGGDGDDFQTFRADLTDDFGAPAAPAAPEAPAHDPHAGLSMGASLDDSALPGPESIAIEGLEVTHDFGRSEPPRETPAPPPATPSRSDVGDLDAGFVDLPMMDFGGEDPAPATPSTPAEDISYGEVSLEPTALSGDEEEDTYGGGMDLPMMDFGGDEDEDTEPEALPLMEEEEEEEEEGMVDLPMMDGFGTVDLPTVSGTEQYAQPEPATEQSFDGFSTIDLPGADQGTVDPPPAEPAPAPAAAAAPADRLEELRARVAGDAADHTARDQLVDLLHERGLSAEALEVLEGAHRTLSDKAQWRDAIVPLSQLIRLRPGDDGPLLQKRVEYAFRSGDRSAMVEAYLALARHFDAGGNADKARAVYGRVLEIEPPNPEAKDAIAALDARRGPAAAPAAPEAQSEEYIDLGALILDDDEPSGGTRFIVEEHEPTGDEDRDFADMLKHFRQKVAENIEVEDSSSHYDLGLAFKEMGLVDEAIAEFQVALRGGWDPLATLEMLGACFADKGQFAVATRVLDRALKLPTSSDAEMVGVLYQLGRSYEAIGNNTQATEFYERVLSVDIRFRDTSARLDSMRRGTGAA